MLEEWQDMEYTYRSVLVICYFWHVHSEKLQKRYYLHLVCTSVCLENLYANFNEIQCWAVFIKLYWRIPVLVEIEHKRRTRYVN